MSQHQFVTRHPRPSGSGTAAFKNLFLLFILAVGWLNAFSAPANSIAAAAMPVPSFSDTTFIKATICSGVSYVFGTQTLTASGVYNETFQASGGGDSIVNLKLTVLPVKMLKRTVSLCDSSFYVFHGDTLTTSGTYTDSLKTPAGCDSLVILKLNFVPYFDIHLSASICANQTYNFGGQILTTRGEYVDSLKAAGGCDSIVTLELTVYPIKPPTNLNATICSNHFYVFQGDTLTHAGTYQAILPDEHGCDSTVVLTLTVNPSPETTSNVSICFGETYAFNGDTLYASGTYIGVFQAANGCDSTVTLQLNVRTVLETYLTATTCDGTPYVFAGQALDQTGMYVATLTAANGCDSTVYLDLHVLPVSTTNQSATICANQTYQFGNVSLNTSGTYRDTLTNQYGCDSILVLTLTVLPVETTTFNASICQGASYPFNGSALTAAGDYSAVLTGSNGCDSTVTVHLSVLPTPQTLIDAHICAGETYNYNGTPIDAAGVYTYGYTAANGCDSTVILHLAVLPAKVSNLTAGICKGQSYPFAGASLTNAGVYTDSLTAYSGCDSLVVLTLTVFRVDTIQLTATICANEHYNFGGTSLNQTGVYIDALSNQYGCDSTVILTLTVLPLQNSELSATICDGQSYLFAGALLTASGDYSAPFTGPNGCDSTVVLHLTVLTSPQTTFEATICAGETATFDGHDLTASGTYGFVYTAANGCDSTVTIILNVLPVPVTNRNVTLCEGLSYAFAGQTLTTGGLYTDTLTAYNGCDSLDILDLKFVNHFETPLSASICSGQTYQFAGLALNHSGVYTDSLKATGGCDSLIILTLTVSPPAATALTSSICAPATYNFHGTALSATGVYTDTLSTSAGCDSIVTLHLNVIPVKASSLTVGICAGSDYVFHGQILSAAGTYTAVLTSASGCDSTITLKLEIKPVKTTTLTASICAGSSYAFSGQHLSNPGTYTATLTSASGCDSIITLNLIVLPVKVTNQTATICSGSSYTFNGEDLTTAGTYQANLTGYQGCDSLVVLELTVLTAPQSEFNATICPGQTYVYNGTTLNQTGVYSFGLPAANGCDSIVTVILTVLPETGSLIVETICKGSSYTFGNQTLTESGSYSAVYPSANGCDSTVTLVLMVDTVQTGVNLVAGTLTAEALNATFQWINCDTNQPVQGETGANFTPTANGNYAVAVTRNGCTATSGCTFVSVVATAEPSAVWQLTLQPNPATGYVFAELSNAPAGSFDFELYDLTGRILLRQPIVFAGSPVWIDLSGLPSGVLLARFSNGHEAITKRLVKAGE